MKKLILFSIALILLLTPSRLCSQESNDREGNSLRMMNFNIHGGVGMDGVRDYQRIADAINDLHPDVVAVQEVDSVTGRSAQVDVLRELAVLTQMFPTYAPAISFDGGKYGIGLLSKEKPMSFRYFALPGKEEERVLLIAEFEKYIFANIHLSLTEADRMASLAIIKREAASAQKPFFIAGDWNAKPDSEFITSMQEDFVLLSKPKQHTYPADAPNETIDYIAVRAKDTTSFLLRSAYVVDEPIASDHRPMVADVLFLQPKAEIFRIKPYLQNPVDNGITIMWQTNVPTYSWVEYGTDKENLTKVHLLVDGQVICNNLQHKIRLENLEEGQTYYYRICSQEMLLYQAYRKEFGETAVSDLYTFTLPDPEQTDFTAIIFNDVHKRSQTLQALFSQVEDSGFDFVVFNGDCIDDPANHDQATGFLSEMNEAVGASNVPVFYLRGNHEIRNAYSIGLRALFDYVGDKTYGSFSWGDTRFVMLDCGEDKPDDHWVYYGLNDFTELRNEQVDFLEEELSSKPFKQASKRVLMHHIPLYGGEWTSEPCLELWGKLLDNAPFDVVLNGHTHKMAYFPKDAVGNSYPIMVGGGPSMDNGTVMLLEKKGEVLTLRVINTKGEVLKELTL